MSDDFSTLFEFLPIGAYRSLPDGRQLRANPALVRLNGYDSEAAMLEGVRDIAIEWYAQAGRRQQFVERLLAEGRVVGFESEIYRHRSRERIWISENAHIVRDALGAVRYFEGTVEDISDRVVAREALHRSQRELEQIVALVPGMVYRVIVLPDGDRRATFVSAGVRELFELEPEDVLRDGKIMHRLRHVDDMERMRLATAEAARDRRPIAMDYRVQLPSGKVKWVQMLSAPAPAENGHEVRIGMALDITQRKQSEQALLENSQLWKRALESSGDGVWDWLVQDGVEVLSPACKALYGYAEGELPDTPGALDERTHTDDLAAMHLARDQHFAGRTPSYVNEHRVRCKDGQWKWILSRGIVIQRDAHGRPLRMVGTHTDITAAREAEALRHERDRAAAADLAKSQFLSRVSHELRTPLNAILGFAQLLEMQPGDTERQRRWVRQVLASGEHLLALVDDVLDLSAAQTGEMRLRIEALALPPLVAEALAMLHGAGLAAGVVIHDDSAGDWTLRADRRRLVQVIANLVSNAIKYNQRGGWVRVSARREGDDVLVQVSDNGPGLSESQQARLFQPFERLDAPRGTVSGTGLGLALVRQFTEAMDGRIAVDSAPGRGATFTVRLPAA